MNSKKGQVTIFIIVAVLIVIAFVLFFVLRSKIGIISPDIFNENPEGYIDHCLKPKLEEAVDLVSKQGGYIQPVLFKTFENESIAYLCYQENFYLSCINQESVLIQHLKDEIKGYIDAEMNDCFNEMKSDYEEEGNSVTLGLLDYDIVLESAKVIVDMRREVTINYADETKQLNSFQSILRNPLYDLAIVAQEINNQEARFCSFNQEGFMLLYSSFDIDKLRLGEGTTIYTIADKKSGEFFRFAVRSCVLPPGIG